MSRANRTLAALIIALTLAINVACAKDGEDNEEAPPINALAQQEVAYSAITAEAKKSEQRRNYGAYMTQLKEKRRIALAEKREQRRLELVEIKRKRAVQQRIRTEKAVQVSRGSNYVGRAQTMEATFYTAYCQTGCTGVTASGYNVSNTIYYGGMRILAAPKSIPFYSIMRVTLADGSSFDGIVLDRGGDIGAGRLDVLVKTRDEAYRLGRQTVKTQMIRRGR